MARKRTKRILKKPVRVEKLDTIFTCPFCNHPNTVVHVIDQKLAVGEAGYSICKASYLTKINPFN